MKVALISDLHANIFALRAVLDDLDKENVEKILVSGDIVGYYYWPSEVIKLLQGDDRFICIRGNHEDILQNILDDDDAAARYRRKYGSGYDCCIQQLSAENLKWLKALPAHTQVTIDGMQFYLGHGSLSSTDEYLYPDAPLHELLRNYSESEFTVFGHTHYPFLHNYEGRYLLNPGSVGQPRDVGGLASYIIINSENRVIRFKRKPFDTAQIVKAACEYDPGLGYLAAIMDR
jgi:putative phosphoesterase